jgi:isopenicillin-N epimerase
MCSLHIPDERINIAAATNSLLPPLQDALRDRYDIEVPVVPAPSGSGLLIRISAAAYNEIDDYDRLAKALSELLNPSPVG